MTLTVSLEFTEAAPSAQDLDDLFYAYYQQIAERLLQVGGPVLSVTKLVDGARDDISDYLPPRGGIVLARESSGFLMGCGFLRLMDPERAELKRLFVHDVARGMGLGRRLIEMRIEKARELGAKTVFADTVYGNSSMLRLYDSFGFHEVPRYPGNANPDSLDPFLVYRRLDLT